MIYKDYKTLKDEVLRETDAEAEDFIQPKEVLDYFNDAVREALAHIQKLGLEDDYFQKSATTGIVAGVQELNLPNDIYAAKIRGVIYSMPSEVYQIKRIKGPNKFQLMQELLLYPPGNPMYMYDLENPSPTSGFRIKLYPIPVATIPSCIIINYVRTVTTIAADTDLVDIPEFYSFIKAFVKYKIFSKENSERAISAKEEYEKEKQLMMETLSEMTPDYDNKVIGDFTHYHEHS